MNSLKIIQASNEHFEASPKLVVGPCYTIKASGTKPTLTLIKVRDSEGQTVMVQTAPFTLTHGPIKTEDGQYLFGSNKEDAPELCHILTSIEKAADTAMTTNATAIEALPEKFVVRSDGDNLRPMVNAKGKIYFKLASDCTVYNWNGRHQYKEELRGGRYQLLLRLSNIYLGAHGSTNYQASLQVKVAQVRYDPSTELAEQGSRQTDTFLFLPESTHDYSVNNFPPGQLHAMDLGLMDSETDSQSVASTPQPTPKKRAARRTPTRRAKKSKAAQPTYSPASPDHSVDEDTQWYTNQWMANFDASQQTHDPAMWNSGAPF